MTSRGIRCVRAQHVPDVLESPLDDLEAIERVVDHCPCKLVTIRVVTDGLLTQNVFNKME